MSLNQTNNSKSAVERQNEVAELKSKLQETKEEAEQWERSYDNLYLLLIDFGKQIEYQIQNFDANDDELKKEKYAHRCFRPMLEKLNDNFEKVLWNAEVTMRDVYQFKVDSTSSNEFKIAALLNEMKSSYTGYSRLGPKARLEKLLKSSEFGLEALQRGLHIEIGKLTGEAIKRILTLVNTEKNNGS